MAKILFYDLSTVVMFIKITNSIAETFAKLGSSYFSTLNPELSRGLDLNGVARFIWMNLGDVASAVVNRFP